jgi:hypothetical protein
VNPAAPDSAPSYQTACFDQSSQPCLPAACKKQNTESHPARKADFQEYKTCVKV